MTAIFCVFNKNLLFIRRFFKKEVTAEIYENEPRKSYVTHIQAHSASSLLFNIVDGNVDDMFFINPSVGVLITKNSLDYETKKFYNLTVEAVNMVNILYIIFFVPLYH